jgi:hypothetical protein
MKRGVKFLPPDNTISAKMGIDEDEALKHYQQRIIDHGHDLNEVSVNKYDFNRGFEYGIQWALDNLEWLEKYREYSHYGFHHPLNYEKSFSPTGKPRGDE